MYAEKKQRKHWHDQYVKTNRFCRGDLVLLYTLKKHKIKLKLQGLGPFVVNDLNTSGAVRLETLDGEPMGDYINGSRLKWYEEPMTKDMLVCLHVAQTQKEGQALLKQHALAEAQARAAKAKARHKAMVMTIQISDDEEFVEPFNIQMCIHTKQASYDTSTLIDSGVDCNVLSYNVWEALGKPQLTNVKMNFQSFSGEETKSLGKCLH